MVPLRATKLKVCARYDEVFTTNSPVLTSLFVSEIPSPVKLPPDGVSRVTFVAQNSAPTAGASLKNVEFRGKVLLVSPSTRSIVDMPYAS